MKQKTILSILGILFLLFGCKPTDKDVFLVIGQSNTAGRAEIEVEDTVKLENVYLLNDKGKWEPAKNPLNKYSNIRKKLSMQKLGYAYTFGKMVHDSTGREIRLVVNARGGTSISKWQQGASDAYFDSTYVRIKEALGTSNAKLKGVIWHQGEGDKRRTSTYLTKLEQLINDLRDTLGITDLPFIAGQLSQARPENAKFNEMILELPNTIPNTYVVRSDGLKTIDSTHFNSEGQRILGKRYAMKALKEIYKSN